MTKAPALYDFSRPIAGVRIPDTTLAREAADYVRAVSTPMLFHHVMRSFVFAQLLGGKISDQGDQEAIFLSTVMHDLGLTDEARGPRRFELEGADAARRFLSDRRCPSEKSWLVWDTIALHTWNDINLYKEPEARSAQIGIMADAVGAGIATLAPEDLAEVVAAFPRLGFKQNFTDLLRLEAETKPQTHTVHPVHMIAHHCCYPVPIPDAAAIIQAAGFDE